jgi:hypothetical protein
MLIDLVCQSLRCESKQAILDLEYQWPSHARLGVDWILPMARRGEHWRKNRRLLEGSLRPGAAPYRRMIEEKTRGLLGQLLSTPKDFRSHIDLSVASSSKVAQPLTYLQSPRENYYVTHLWL